jgi:hypothetical protein
MSHRHFCDYAGQQAPSKIRSQPAAIPPFHRRSATSRNQYGFVCELRTTQSAVKIK